MSNPSIEQQSRVLIAQELFLIISTRSSEPGAPYGKERIRRDRIESIAEGPSGTTALHLTSGRTVWSPSDPRRVETVLAEAHAKFDRPAHARVDVEREEHANRIEARFGLRRPRAGGEAKS